MHLTSRKYYFSFVFLFLLLIVLVFISISTGSLHIPFGTIWDALFFTSDVPQNYQYIITQYRLPNSITSILVGAGLGVSGLLMQTYFKNPLAGPFVLGISAGSSLGVALLIMGGSFLGTLPYFSQFSIPLAASLGAFLVLSIVMIAAKNIRNTMSILIIGLMFGSFASAMISVLSYFSSASKLQQYVFWSFGNLNNLQWSEVYFLGIVLFLCAIGLIFILKPLNALLLGENYAKSLGVSLKRTQSIIFIITSLLTGSITAFVGPIAFIGLAIPHIAKLLFTSSNHTILIPATAILGAIVMLICSTLAHIPFSSKSLPINAITSLFGAPIIIWLLISKSQKIS